MCVIEDGSTERARTYGLRMPLQAGLTVEHLVLWWCKHSAGTNQIITAVPLQRLYSGFSATWTTHIRSVIISVTVIEGSKIKMRGNLQLPTIAAEKCGKLLRLLGMPVRISFF